MLRVTLTKTLRWMREHRLGPDRIIDAHLGAVLQMDGLKRLFTSNPADLTVFGAMETIIP